jgi:hypothetical protein
MATLFCSTIWMHVPNLKQRNCSHFLALFVAFFIWLPNIAHAQAPICGEAPPLFDETIRGSIDGKLGVFSKLVGSAEFIGTVEIERNEILSKYPKADQLLLKQYYLYNVCIVIMQDPNLSTERKIDLYSKSLKIVLSASQERSNWINGQSFSLSVLSFDYVLVNQYADGYGATMTFLIQNDSDRDVGIGVSEIAAGTCRDVVRFRGMPWVLKTYGFVQNNEILYSDLTDNPDPSTLLKWLPSGSSATAVIDWNYCDKNVPIQNIAIGVVVAQQTDIVELNISSK